MWNSRYRLTENSQGIFQLQVVGTPNPCVVEVSTVYIKSLVHSGNLVIITINEVRARMHPIRLQGLWRFLMHEMVLAVFRFSLRWRSCGVGGLSPWTGKGRPRAAATDTAPCSPRWRTAPAASRRRRPARAWCSSQAKPPGRPADSPTATWLYLATSGVTRSRTACHNLVSVKSPRKVAGGREMRF